jgi:hypothetical protein
MLPLAVGSAATLRWRARAATGVERTVCIGGFWAVIALFLLRDIGLSRRLAELFEKMQHLHKNFKDFVTGLK